MGREAPGRPTATQGQALRRVQRTAEEEATRSRIHQRSVCDLCLLVNVSSSCSFRAQLQQLESRLRYSKTDKDTAEKKQRVLIEKDLVDFQSKLSVYEVSAFRLHAVPSPCSLSLSLIILAEDQRTSGVDRRTREARLETTRAEEQDRRRRLHRLLQTDSRGQYSVSSLDDRCTDRSFLSLSIYEDRELQAAEKRAQERLEFENQMTKIQTMLEFERSRDTAAHVEQVTREVATLEEALLKCQKNEKKYRKVG